MSRLYLLAVLALCSCAPAYISNTRNTPLFGEANEFSGVVALSSGIDAQAAYSLTDHVALMANGNLLLKKYANPEFNRDHRFGEAGIGFFSHTKAFRFEIFGGFGMGQGNSYESFYFFQTSTQEVVAHGKYRRIFVQPSIGTNTKKFSISFTPRFSMVSFTEFSTDDPLANVKTHRPTEGYHLFLEPAITTRFHLVGNIHGFLQLGLNKPAPDDVYFSSVPLQASIGIQIHTGGLRARVY